MKPDASHLPSSCESPARGSSNRAFGLVFCVFFLLVACWPVSRGGAIRGWAIAVAALIGLLAVLWPRLLAWPNRLWMKFGELLHRITSPIAVAAIYLIGVVPVGVVMRVLGQDPLRRARRPDAATYWIEREPHGRPDARMKRQF